MAAHPELLAYSIDFSREIDNQVLTKLFKSAADNAPALIVFEDLDRLYGRRKEEAQRDVNDNYTHITLQHLLNCLDGVGTRDGVIVVATANDVAALDPALLSRPGRFDRTVYFGPPSVELRAEYLRRLDAVQTLSPAAIARVAAACEGLSFAQVRDVYVLAGQRAFERSARGGSVEDVGDADLLAALEAKMTEMDDLKRSLSGRRVGFGRRSRDAGPA
jgi:ATP-dependent 26S proteasome regulatory subunit